MNVKKLFYIYVDSTFDGRPFYVGKGVTERVNCNELGHKRTTCPKP